MAGPSVPAQLSINSLQSAITREEQASPQPTLTRARTAWFLAHSMAAKSFTRTCYMGPSTLSTLASVISRGKVEV